ncbi:hypothetical protein ATKI12_5274 [Kitasatospora sp. Ki12]
MEEMARQLDGASVSCVRQDGGKPGEGRRRGRCPAKGSRRRGDGSEVSGGGVGRSGPGEVGGLSSWT